MPPKPHARQAAERWLRAQLADGPVHGRRLVASAKEVGISESTLFAAKRELDIIHVRESPTGAKPGAGRWLWAVNTRTQRRETRARLIDELTERIDAGGLDAESRAAYLRARDTIARQDLRDAKASDGHVCAHCGKAFRPNRARGQLYCQRRCASRAATARAKARRQT